MTICQLTGSSPLLTQVMEINREAFPPEERLSREEFLRLQEEEGADIIAFLAGSETAGFAVVMRARKTAYVLHFAVRADLRGQGFGGEAIDALKKEYAGSSLCLDFEPPDPRSENAEQRLRRRDFYLRRGFHPVNARTYLRGNEFEVVCAGDFFDAEALGDIVKRIHRIQPGFGSEIVISVNDASKGQVVAPNDEVK